jgi:hypothetical protein
MEYIIIPLFTGLILTLAVFGFIKKRNHRINKKRLDRSYKDHIVHLDEYDKGYNPKTLKRLDISKNENNVIF